MSERDVDQDQVRAEHLEEVDERLHWAYLAVILVGGTVAMILFIALLGSAG